MPKGDDPLRKGGCPAVFRLPLCQTVIKPLSLLKYTGLSIVTDDSKANKSNKNSAMYGLHQEDYLTVLSDLFDLPSDEQLQKVLQCSYCKGGIYHHGWLYISQNYFSFLSQVPFLELKAKFSLPLRSIEEVKPAAGEDVGITLVMQPESYNLYGFMERDSAAERLQDSLRDYKLKASHFSEEKLPPAPIIDADGRVEADNEWMRDTTDLGAIFEADLNLSVDELKALAQKNHTHTTPKERTRPRSSSRLGECYYGPWLDVGGTLLRETSSTLPLRSRKSTDVAVLPTVRLTETQKLCDDSDPNGPKAFSLLTCLRFEDIPFGDQVCFQVRVTVKQHPEDAASSQLTIGIALFFAKSVLWTNRESIDDDSMYELKAMFSKWIASTRDKLMDDKLPLKRTSSGGHTYSLMGRKLEFEPQSPGRSVSAGRDCKLPTTAIVVVVLALLLASYWSLTQWHGVGTAGQAVLSDRQAQLNQRLAEMDARERKFEATFQAFSDLLLMDESVLDRWKDRVTRLGDDVGRFEQAVDDIEAQILKPGSPSSVRKET